MGALGVTIGVGDRDGRRFERVEALVGTGSTYTWIPRPVLQGLGLRPEKERIFELTDGRQVTYGIAWATVQINGERQPTIVVFGDDNTEPLLGVVTLEEFGLGVDVVGQRLIPTPGLLKRQDARSDPPYV